jgi:hypothetical protein
VSNNGDPFNQTEAKSFALTAREKYRQGECKDVWDLYNAGTELLKPGNIDSRRILNSVGGLTSYIRERYPVIEEEFSKFNFELISN